MKRQLVIICTLIIFGAISCSKKDKVDSAGNSAVSNAPASGVAPVSQSAQPGSPESVSAAKPAGAVAKVAGTAGSVAVSAPGTDAALPVAPAISGSAGLPAAPAVPAAPIISCFTLSYQHKKMASHNSEEVCGQHKNKLKLRHDNVNKGAMCVRVDGRPVGFQFVKKDEIVIGPTAGPDSKITVRYCLNKVKCNEDCKVPKDDFMDAIGANNDGDKGGWAESGDEKDKKNAARLSTLEADLKKELSDTEESDLFAGWLNPEGAENYTCGTRQAGKPTSDGNI